MAMHPVHHRSAAHVARPTGVGGHGRARLRDGLSKNAVREHGERQHALQRDSNTPVPRHGLETPPDHQRRPHQTNAIRPTKDRQPDGCDESHHATPTAGRRRPRSTRDKWRGKTLRGQYTSTTATRRKNHAHDGHRHRGEDEQNRDGTQQVPNLTIRHETSMARERYRSHVGASPRKTTARHLRRHASRRHGCLRHRRRHPTGPLGHLPHRHHRAVVNSRDAHARRATSRTRGRGI